MEQEQNQKNLTGVENLNSSEQQSENLQKGTTQTPDSSDLETKNKLSAGNIRLEQKEYFFRNATVGRIVMFYPGKEDTIARTGDVDKNAAMVVQVLDGTTINLRVFTVTGDALPLYTNIPHKSVVDLANENEHYWDWPEIK